MKLKATYDNEIGFVFPGLADEIQYKIWHERKNNQLYLLMKGVYAGGRFELEYSKQTNFVFFTYADENADGKLKDINYTLYSRLKDVLVDLELLFKSKKEVRYWKTNYFENQFEQDYVDPDEDHSRMIWRKKGVLWIAQGKNGKFIIRQLHRTYKGRYEGKEKCFNLPPKKKISEMKTLCRENIYWEG